MPLVRVEDVRFPSARAGETEGQTDKQTNTSKGEIGTSDGKPLFSLPLFAAWRQELRCAGWSCNKSSRAEEEGEEEKRKGEYGRREKRETIYLTRPDKSRVFSSSSDSSFVPETMERLTTLYPWGGEPPRHREREETKEEEGKEEKDDGEREREILLRKKSRREGFSSVHTRAKREERNQGRRRLATRKLFFRENRKKFRSKVTQRKRMCLLVESDGTGAERDCERGESPSAKKKRGKRRKEKNRMRKREERDQRPSRRKREKLLFVVPPIRQK